MLFIFLQGLVLGFSVAAPVGPIGVLCIRRTLQYGFWAGVTGGLGTALADSLYAGIAAFGITLLSNLLRDNEVIIRIVGGIFLLFLAYKAITAPLITEKMKLTHKGAWQGFATTFVMTLTSPATIVTFAAVFAGFGIINTKTNYESLLLITGVFIGSMLWWFLLSYGVNRLRSASFIENSQHINRFAGGVLLVFALWAIIGAVL